MLAVQSTIFALHSSVHDPNPIEKQGIAFGGRLYTPQLQASPMLNGIGVEGVISSSVTRAGGEKNKDGRTEARRIRTVTETAISEE